MKLCWWPWEAVQATTRLVETSAATRSVLGARLPMIFDAIGDPMGADHRELSLMMTEKVDAFGRSQRVLAAAGEAMRRTAGANAAALGRLAGGGVLGPTDWITMFERNVSLAVTLMSLPMRAMAPVHKGVTGNARRLRRR